MKIDLDSMSYHELLNLNHKIVERLRFLDSIRTHKEMMQFNRGDRVSFDTHDHGTLTGILVKYNRKTVTVITDSGQKWNVSPLHLRKANRIEPGKNQSGNVVKFGKK